MKKQDAALRQQLNNGLAHHEKRRPMRGVLDLAYRECLIEQLIESERRVRYVTTIRARRMSPTRADPSTADFDPIRGALFYYKQGSLDEACWLVFLFVLFGKHLKDGYRLARDVYNGDGGSKRWTWDRVSADPRGFTAWLKKKDEAWKTDGIKRRFGNHRKYESLPACGSVVESYVTWVKSSGSHSQLIAAARKRAANHRGRTFEDLYQSMAVKRFGRMAKFDYLAMLGKLGLADIEPTSTYVRESTGPLLGARLLFRGDRENKADDKQLDGWLVELGGDLGVGQQVIEDAICNWQKSPAKFLAFRG